MSSALEPGQVFAKDFQIERRLSQGGMGAVYVARQLSTDKLRALKLMLPQLAPDVKSRQRFIDEARIGARIDSEHVVEVVAAGIDETTQAPWLAMELLEGEDLGTLSSRRGPLPPGEVREVFLQAGHALALAHSKGIVHRDLKPENLFLARARRQGQASVVKVLDFGIATALPTGGAGVVTTAVGSPFWMAPEQATPGASLQPSTDVWALGLIAFQLLTGSSYWKSAKLSDVSIGAVLTEILMEPLVLASARASELGLAPLPKGFDEWFACCVTRKTDTRFVDAASCLTALDALLEKVAPRVPVSFSSPVPEAVVRAEGLEATFQRATPFPASPDRGGPEPVAPLPPRAVAIAAPLVAPGVVAPPVPVPVAVAPAPSTARRSPVGLIIGVVGVAVAFAAVWSRPGKPESVTPLVATTSALEKSLERQPAAVETPPAEVEKPPDPAKLAPPVPQPPVVVPHVPSVPPPPVVTQPPVPPEVNPLDRRQRRAERAQRDFSIDLVTVSKGDGCKAGRGVTFEEAKANAEALCGLIGKWSIVRLAGGGSMDGSGYQCKVRPSDERRTGESLCVK